MDMFVVQGSRRLEGCVRLSGAKNAALPIMAAALAAEGPCRLFGVPDLADVWSLAGLLRQLGMQVERDAGGWLHLEVRDPRPCVAEYETVRRMRASVCVLGPLVARRGRACVSLPGGCNIGDRPIDLHLRGLQALGADVRIERGYVVAEARRLRGADIYLGGPYGSTVTGTCNVMVAAALAKGRTTITAAACEPEVVDLGRFLNAMGARIDGLGTPVLTIDGVDGLAGTDHAIIPDRIEAGTLMIAAALTRGDVTITNVRPDHLTAVIETLRAMGVAIDVLDPSPQAVEQVIRSDSVRIPADAADEPPALVPFPGNSQTGPTQASPAAGVPTSSPSWAMTASGTDARVHDVPAARFGSGRSDTAGEATAVRVRLDGRPLPTDCVALPYPAFPTDLQAQLMALACVARGTSVITDRVFPDRFLHAAELVRLGARIRREGPTAVVTGVERLSGANLMASDLRASAALVLAALAADGESVVRRIYHLERGYERFEEKLNALGARIRRVSDSPENQPLSWRVAVDALDADSPPEQTPAQPPAEETPLRRRSA